MRPVVLRLESGRLGNQLFQYAALRSLNPQKLFLGGFSELFSVFSNVQGIRVAHDSRPIRIVASLTKKFQTSFGRLGEDPRTGAISGSCKQVTYCERETYYQSDMYMDAISGLEFSSSIVSESSILAVKHGLNRAPYLIVHARGADYKIFPSQKYPAILPHMWMARQALSIAGQTGIDRILVFGDDKELKEKVANACSGTVIDGSFGSDMYLMSHAAGGVISASSFSWWATAFAWLRNGNAGSFIAPHYWFGHRARMWMPQSIAASKHLQFVCVDDEE